MKYLNVFFFTLIFNTNVLAGVTGAHTLGELKVGEGGVRIQAESGTWADEERCSGQDATRSVYLSENTNNFSEIYSAMLAYKIAGRAVNFYVGGCITVNGVTYPSVSVIYL